MWKKATRCGYYLVEAALVLGKTQTGKALQNYNASRDNMYDLVPVVYFERARGTSRGKMPAPSLGAPYRSLRISSAGVIWAIVKFLFPGSVHLPLRCRTPRRER